MTHPSTDLAELEVEELEAQLDALRVAPFHARQLYCGSTHGVSDIDRMTDLGRPLRAMLKTEFVLTTPRIVKDEVSIDGTRKFLLELADRRQIEAVFIPDTPAMTFCISTQVGCAMSCGFCLTGKMGLVEPDSWRDCRPGPRARCRHRVAGSNVQYRSDGHGRAAAQLRQHAKGTAHAPFGAWPRGIASTDHVVDCRYCSRPRPPGSRTLMPNLAISLHATTDQARTAPGAAKPQVCCRRFSPHAGAFL